MLSNTFQPVQIFFYTFIYSPVLRDYSPILFLSCSITLLHCHICSHTHKDCITRFVLLQFESTCTCTFLGFILTGSWILHHFAYAMYFFGVILVYAAVKMFFSGGEVSVAFCVYVCARLFEPLGYVFTIRERFWVFVLRWASSSRGY